MDGGDPAGGSRELLGLIEEHGDCLFYDLWTLCRIDLREVFRDGSGISPRLVLALVRQFPQDSATVAAIRGGEQFRGWSVGTYILANIFDAIQNDTHAFISANSKKKPKAPEPFPRPEKRARKKVSMFAAMARNQYKKMRKSADGGSGS